MRWTARNSSSCQTPRPARQVVPDPDVRAFAVQSGLALADVYVKEPDVSSHEGAALADALRRPDLHKAAIRLDARCHLWQRWECAMSTPDPPASHDMHERELAHLLERVRAGEVPAVMMDQATAERWIVRVIGALVRLQQLHQLDKRGRCSVCWTMPRPWRRRTTCTVDSTLGFFLRQSDRSVLTALTNNPAHHRGSS